MLLLLQVKSHLIFSKLIRFFKIAKKLKGEEEWIAFQKEADILEYVSLFFLSFKLISNFSKMRHPNVLQYLGVYTAEDGSKYIITDYMNQVLFSFLF
jgi:hypothetical protein